MKTIYICTLPIVLLCLTNVYGVENRDVQGVFYSNARVIKEKAAKLSSRVDDLVAMAKKVGYHLPEPLYKFTRNECSEYFLDPIGKQYAVFYDSKYMGIHAIQGYSTFVVGGSGEYIYKIDSDFESVDISGTLNLFNVDFNTIPQQAKVRIIDNTNTYNIYISSTGIDGRSNTIQKVYGIDIDKNGHEDFVILSEGWDNTYDYVIDVTELTIVMNIASKPKILKLGNTSFPFVLNGFNDMFDVSFVDYDENQPVLLSIAEGKAGSGWGGRVLYCYEKGTFTPLFSDFSYSN